MASERSEATEEESFWGEWRRLELQGRSYGYLALVVPGRLPTWVPAWFHTGVASIIGVIWSGLVWGPPWRVMVLRQHRRRLIVRTARFTVDMYDDLAAASGAARHIDAELAAGKLWEPQSPDPS
jgi:hypothetical protein